MTVQKRFETSVQVIQSSAIYFLLILLKLNLEPNKTLKLETKTLVAHVIKLAVRTI